MTCWMLVRFDFHKMILNKMNKQLFSVAALKAFEI